MAPELSVLVPCFNEEGNLPELVERTERIFDRRGIAGEIILVDDGSQDGTGAEIDALAAAYFYFQTFVTVAAKAKGFSMRQVETLFDQRRAGRSFIGRVPVGLVGKTIVDIGRALVEFRVREPKDQSLALAVGDGAAPSPTGEEAWRRRYYRAYRTLLPVHHWAISRNAPRYLDELRRTQWLPREEVEQLQLKRLRRLVHHAEAHVGYYRELFQTAGVTPESIRSLDDLRRIPVLTKQVLRENL